MQATVIVTHEFESLVRHYVTSEKVFWQIYDVLSKLEHVPTIGSARGIPKSIAQKYGSNMRRIPVSPFLILYEYHPGRNEVVVESLMFEREAK